MMPFLNLQRIKIANVTNKLNIVFLIDLIERKGILCRCNKKRKKEGMNDEVKQNYYVNVYYF